MSKKRSDDMLRARLCEAAERYDDMVKIMSELVKEADSPLYMEERSLLSVAFKNAVSTRRESWRVLNAREREKTDAKSITACQDIKNKVETEVRKLCEEMINLIDNPSLSHSSLNSQHSA